MKTLGTIAGSTAIVVLAAWAILGEIPSKSSSVVRAQVSDLENPEGKVIPFGKDGIEVLTQGPVHEAFAQPATGKLEVEVTVRKRPPEPIPELPPEQRPEGDNVIWISGYWGWDVDRNDFLWVSGFWRAAPPGRAWVPGYWNEDDGSWHWVAGYWSEQTQATVELLPPPPEPVEEAPPPQEVADSTYVSGTWVYREQRYWWRPGFWVGHRPGWTWTRAHYVWTPGGYCFVDGYWDYDFHRRGILYAPAFIHSRYHTAGWHYRPHYAIETDLFLAALFVRPAWGHYYFGDYYDARYAGLGFSPWLDYRIGGRWHDPAWNYYRWRHRDDPRWERDIRQAYVTRRQDTTARPPRTLAEQERRAVSPTGAQVALIQPVTKLQSLQTSKIKLQTISKTEVQQFRKNALNVQNFRDQRSKVELQAKTKAGVGPGRPPVTVQLQRPGGQTFPKGAEAAPPSPTLPKFGTQAPPKGPAQKPAPGKKGGPDDDDDKSPAKKKVITPPKQPDQPPLPPKKKGPADDDDPPAKKKVAPPPKQPDQPPPKKKAPPPRDDEDRPPPPAKKSPPPKQSDPPPPPPKKQPPPQRDADDPPPAKKAPPPKSKGKGKDEGATSHLRPGNPLVERNSFRSLAYAERSNFRSTTAEFIGGTGPVPIFTQSTLGERGAFSPEDPRLIRFPVRRC